jgi:hypothetical protein
MSLLSLIDVELAPDCIAGRFDFHYGCMSVAKDAFSGFAIPSRSRAFLEFPRYGIDSSYTWPF